MKIFLPTVVITEKKNLEGTRVSMQEAYLY